MGQGGAAPRRLTLRPMVVQCPLRFGPAFRGALQRPGDADGGTGIDPLNSSLVAHGRSLNHRD